MNQATAQLLATALNGAFVLLAGMRRKGLTDREIRERLDRVDAGEPAVTAEEVIAAESEWQAAINEGRQIP